LVGKSVGKTVGFTVAGVLVGAVVLTGSNGGNVGDLVVTVELEVGAHDGATSATHQKSIAKPASVINPQKKKQNRLRVQQSRLTNRRLVFSTFFATRFIRVSLCLAFRSV
jgi:hypothetical protein